MPDRSGRESDVSRWSYLILVVVEAGENVSDQSWVACDTCLVSQREMPTAGFLSELPAVCSGPSAMLRSSLKVTHFPTIYARTKNKYQTSLPVRQPLLWLRTSTISTTVQSTSADTFSLVTGEDHEASDM